MEPSSKDWARNKDVIEGLRENRAKGKQFKELRLSVLKEDNYCPLLERRIIALSVGWWPAVLCSHKGDKEKKGFDCSMSNLNEIQRKTFHQKNIKLVKDFEGEYSNSPSKLSWCCTNQPGFESVMFSASQSLHPELLVVLVAIGINNITLTKLLWRLRDPVCKKLEQGLTQSKFWINCSFVLYGKMVSSKQGLKWFRQFLGMVPEGLFDSSKHLKCFINSFIYTVL